MPESKINFISSNLQTSDNIKTQKLASCHISNPTQSVVESKNIHVEKDFGFRSWCNTTSSKRQNDLRYFVLNDSQESSIMSIGSQTQNKNDSFSSDIILNIENSASAQNLNPQDQSAIRYDSKMQIELQQ